MADPTTVSIYRADLDWLQNRQLTVSTERSTVKRVWVTMPDVLHELIEAVRHAEEGA